MLIHRIDPASYQSAYDILCQAAAPSSDEVHPPFYPMWCLVGPGQTARAHKHQEHEAFVIARGRGMMRVDDETTEVGPGDMIVMPPFHTHELRNLSDEEDLLFLDICWEVLPEAAEANRKMLREAAETRPQRVLITATPPTPNGDLHVGHLSGPYLCGDIHRRYLSMRGVEVAFLTGIDDHQTYVTKKARLAGLSPREVVDGNAKAMAQTWSAAGIEWGHIARPDTSAHHILMVQECFHRLYEAGAIVDREAPTLYCESCEAYLFEAAVTGACPVCHEGSDGNACEACGHPNDCVELLEPHCVPCGAKPTVKTVRRLYFPLAPFEERLRKYWASVHMNPHLRSLCEAMLERGLPDIAVSQVGDWGVPVGLPGFEDQCIYVWFEMGPGYLAATQELVEKSGHEGGWASFWKSQEAQVVQFFGYDNGYYHAVLFPATFMAMEEEIVPPAAFVTNEFYLYEGSKFSTSRNHAMWGRELLEQVPADIARFYLSYDGPEGEPANFSFAELKDRTRRELVETWQPWLQGLGQRVQEGFPGGLPGTGGWTAEQQSFFAFLQETIAQVSTAYEAASYSGQMAARALCELVRRSRKFGRTEQYWEGLTSRFEERRTALALEALAAKVLAQLSAPIMPEFANRLWQALGYEGGVEEAGWEMIPTFVPGGRDLGGLRQEFFSLTATDSQAEPAILSRA